MVTVIIIIILISFPSTHFSHMSLTTFPKHFLKECFWCCFFFQPTIRTEVQSYHVPISDQISFICIKRKYRFLDLTRSLRPFASAYALAYCIGMMGMFLYISVNGLWIILLRKKRLGERKEGNQNGQPNISYLGLHTSSIKKALL